MPPDGKRKPLLGKQCIGKEWGNFPSFIEQNILSHTKKSILNAIPREQYPCMPGGMYIYVPTLQGIYVQGKESPLEQKRVSHRLPLLTHSIFAVAVLHTVNIYRILIGIVEVIYL